MREKIEEITKATDALYQMSLNHERGSVILWPQIEAISGSRKDGRARHIINKWRRRLERDRDIVTLCADQIGVRFLTHSETAVEIPRLRQRKAYRQVRRAIKQTATVDVARLSAHERRMLAAQRENMAIQRRELFRSQRDLANGIAPTEGNPRRQIA